MQTRFVALALTVSIGFALGCSAQSADPQPADWAKQSPVFRGPLGSGYFEAKNVPTDWNEKAKKNILWKVAVPLGGLSSPVVWGDKIILTGATKEKRQVFCFSTKEGALLWTGTYPTDPKASTEYEVYASLAEVMEAAPTPAVDGKRAYAMFANGELVAFDLQTGKMLWTKIMGDTKPNQYGLSNSLLAYKGNVLVAFDGDDTFAASFDGATGKELWKTKRGDGTWASPILIQDAAKKYQMVVSGSGETAGFDAETGKKLWKFSLVSGDIAPSPTAGGGRVFHGFKDCGIFGVDPNGAGKTVFELKELEKCTFGETVSMVSDGKYLYQFEKDELVCVDAKVGKTVFEKTVEDSASYASPMIVNDNLYLFCGKRTLIGKVGADFEVTSKAELNESFDASPAVVDGRIYIRTGKSLYAIGQ